LVSRKTGNEGFPIGFASLAKVVMLMGLFEDKSLKTDDDKL
jgi:hypothetical protein